MDNELSNNMQKLVCYKILFIKRGFEYAFPEKVDFLAHRTTESDFTAWKIAEFIEELKQKGTEILAEWAEKHYPKSEFVQGDKLIGLPNEDKKYLRVYYEVLAYYPGEELRYEEQKTGVLEKIRNSLAVSLDEDEGNGT